MSDSLLKYLQLFYSSMRFPIQVLNKDGKIIYVNELFTVQWGYSLLELREYSVYKDRELEKTGVQKIIKEVFKQRKNSSVANYTDSLLINRNAAIPLLQTSIFPLSFEGEDYAVLIHEDRTEMVLAEEEIKKARDANKESERLKNTFLNVLSHELRTPLNIILGYSTIIKENLKDKINSEDKVYLDNLYSGGERLFKSITQMLEFAQIEAGNFQLNLDTLDLQNVFNHCIIPYKEKASHKKLDFKANFVDGSVFVEVDLQCTEHVINNLLDNAVKFTQQGFIDVEVGLLEQRGLAICKVKDTGTGISTKYLDHLYQPFSQEDLDVGRTFEGNGLGLALSKRYIEKMGGSLLVDSIKGVGTTFTFTLPLAQKARVTRIEKKPEETNGVSKIIIFDDAGESYDLINVFLKGAYDISVYNYRDFNEELVNEKDYKLILFDITKNFWERGLELCKRVKKNDSANRPVIILSSEFMKDKKQQFYNAGADYFIEKPFSKTDLVDLIKKITS
jgi:signal transduction histidine kinase/CheY-like chemotaxis protein